MNWFERTLFIGACFAAIIGGSIYAYKNVDVGCVTIPWTGKACGGMVAK